MNGLYDPLNYGNLMAGLAAKINEVEMQPLSPTPDVHGPGVYVLYYRGDHEAYMPIFGTEKPIYVGKAAPQAGERVSQWTSTPRRSRAASNHTSGLSRRWTYGWRTSPVAACRWSQFGST